MEMIKSMLDKLYSSQNGMMYFYIISAFIAFILIILIIVTIAKGNTSGEVKEDNKENSQNLKELKSRDMNRDRIDSEEKQLETIEEVKIDSVNQELNLIDDNTSLVGSTLEGIEDDLDLPKVKEVLEENKEVETELSNEVFAERLNALKNKN